MRIGSTLLRHFLIGSCFFLLPLSGEDVRKTIKNDLRRGDDKHLCNILRRNIKQTITISELKALAKEENAKDLLKAIYATRNTKLKNLGISKAEYMSLMHFIKTVTNDKKTRYTRQETGLSHTIEYDRRTKKYFIVLQGNGVYIDRGMKKTVAKALCYQKNGSLVVARAEQTLEMDQELAITKRFGGKPGLFKTLGICHHKNSDKQYHTIYSELYQPGSLQAIFKNDYKLTVNEKIGIAEDIAKGLNTLHKAGVVHRDLGIKNYLINITKGKPGKRHIEACIADFGRAQKASKVLPDPRVQGNTTYMAPEGHFYEKLTKKSYPKLDVFALGCVFYRLVYDKKAEWQTTNYVMQDPRPVFIRYKEHKARVIAATAQRRAELAKQKNRTPVAEFEYLVLRMLHTNPDKRPTAKQVYKTLNKLRVKDLP